MIHEALCRRCAYHSLSARGHECPDCGNGLMTRVSPRVTPASHFKPLLASIFSLTGILFLLFYAASAFLPLPFIRIIAMAALCLVAVKLAWKAMAAERGRIEFPEFSLGDLFEMNKLVPVVLFSLFFVVGPAIALGIAAASESAILVVVAVALFAYAPLALLGYLRHGTSFAFFVPDTPIAIAREDPLTVAGFCAVFLAVLWGGVAIDTVLSSTLLGSALGSAIWAAALLFCFGLTGLLIRKHSRLLEMPVDDDEWGPTRVVELPVVMGASLP